MWNNHKLLKGLANVILMIAIATLCYAFFFWFTHTSLFNFRKIRIYGEIHPVTADQINHVIQYNLKGTFFSLDINRSRALLNQLPWVKEVQIRRDWPGTLNILVTEHIPVARWGQVGLISTEGNFFVASTPHPLPVFYGPAGSEVEMMQMYKAFNQQLKPTGMFVKELSLSERRAWKIILTNQVELALGTQDMIKRVADFTLFWKNTLEILPYKVSYIDMRYSNGFAIQMPDYKAHFVKRN